MYGIKGTVPPMVVCCSVIHSTGVLPGDVQPRSRVSTMQLSYKPLGLGIQRTFSPTQTWVHTFLSSHWKLPEGEGPICAGQCYNPEPSLFSGWVDGWINETSRNRPTSEKLWVLPPLLFSWFLHKDHYHDQTKKSALADSKVKKSTKERVPHKEFLHKEKESRGKVTLKMHMDIF